MDSGGTCTVQILMDSGGTCTVQILNVENLSFFKKLIFCNEERVSGYHKPRENSSSSKTFEINSELAILTSEPIAYNTRKVYVII